MNEISVEDRTPVTLLERAVLGTWQYRFLLWPVWLIVLGAWTAALVTPEPAQFSHETFTPEVGFSLAKALHVSVYAVLAAFGLLLPLPKGWRWLPIGILSGHGLLTEYIQLFVPLRYGCWQDVMIDHVGIVFGIVAAWFLERTVRGLARTAKTQPHLRDSS